MNRKETATILLSVLIFSVFTFGFLLLPVNAPSMPIVYLRNPSTGTRDFVFYTNTTSLGSKFNVTANIDSGTDVYGWQVKVFYDSTLLNATRAWITPGSDPDYIFFGQGTIRPNPNLAIGSALIGDSLVGLVPGVTFTSPKKLGIIEFEIMKAPAPGSGPVSGVLDINNVDTYILDSNLEEIPVVKLDGYYELSPVPAAIPDLYAALRGTSNEILYASYNFSLASWTGLDSLPLGSTVDSPAAAVVSGKVYVVVRGSDGTSLWFGSQNLTTGSFSGWTWISGSTPSAPTLTAYHMTLVLVVRGDNNAIYYRTFNTASQLWGSWQSLPSGATTDKPAAALIGDKLHIVVRGSGANSIWYSSLNMTTSAFSGWTVVPGAISAGPTLATVPIVNTMKLVVTGTDNNIWINTWNGATWQGWTANSNGATNKALAATVVNNNLYIMVTGLNGTFVWQNSLNLGTDTYAGWTAHNWPTVSAPTLTH